MMNVVVSVAVWVVLNTAIVAGVLWLWNRGADHSARQGQRMVMLISFLMFIPGLLPLMDQTELLTRAFLFAITVGAVAAVLGIVLDVRERIEARRRRKDALLRGYPTAPTIIGGWGAFWIGLATYFISGFVLLAASFAWTWVTALAAVANGTPEQWHSPTPESFMVLGAAAFVIAVLVGLAVWARGIVRARYWAQLTAGIEHREAVAATRAAEQVRSEVMQ